MPALRADVDPDGLLEYSVVYTDRALNHMSQRFGDALRTLRADLCDLYNAKALAIVPGSGTFAMEAVARQFATDADVLVLQNGWFSYRWAQILQKGAIASAVTTLKAQPVDPSDPRSAYRPVDLEEALAAIYDKKPKAIFAPHVETASAIALPEDYIERLAQAARDVDALLVIDAIASGCVWLDTQRLGIDVLVSAPQKGWSGSPCAGFVFMNDRALLRLEQSASTSFALDLERWLGVMRAFESGGHAYYATMPTDALYGLYRTLQEYKAFGADKLKAAQLQLGQKMRALLRQKGFCLLADEDFAAPGVIVVYTDDDRLHKGVAFAEEGVQIAAGVPLQVGEPPSFKTFRVGLFGIDKLADVDGAIARFAAALDKVVSG